MNMSTAFLAAGGMFCIGGIWFGALPFIVGAYYIGAFVVSSLFKLGWEDYGWWAVFALVDLLLAAFLHFKGYGPFASSAAAVLILSSCVTAYAGREGGFLYSHYAAIGGVLNALFIWFIIWQVVEST